MNDPASMTVAGVIVGSLIGMAIGQALWLACVSLIDWLKGDA